MLTRIVSASQNFANTISAKNELEQRLKLKLMDHASYENKLQQVGMLALGARARQATHPCVSVEWSVGSPGVMVKQYACSRGHCGCP